MVNPVDEGENYCRSSSMLKRIAAALDQPEQTFFGEPPTGIEFDDTIELLRIWGDLEYPADRRKLLAFAQAIVTGRR